MTIYVSDYHTDEQLEVVKLDSTYKLQHITVDITGCSKIRIAAKDSSSRYLEVTVANMYVS